VNWGWTIGAGMEYGIENWSLGIEYLYVDLGDADWDGDLVEFANSNGELFDTKGSVDYQFSVFRATAKLRF
jgi:opacity protein-like surface antigen